MSNLPVTKIRLLKGKLGKSKTANHRVSNAESLRRKIDHMLDKSPPEQLALFHQFIRQAITCFDPDTVQTFLEWQRDPVIDSILSLASKMDMEDRDQLLFVAEDMYEAD